MARDRDSKELPGASSTSGQSKSGGRPPFARTESDNSNSTETSHAYKNKRQHHVKRMHARVPSSKALHNKGHRRAISPDPSGLHQPPQRLTAHRRATSEVKLPRDSPTSNLPKNVSQTSLKKNRSYGDVHKRTKSAEKVKRHSGGTTTPGHRPKSSKSQVHFDLGSDEYEEEGDWVDASGSNSPHMSRKGSVNSSAQSSLKPTASANDSRPETPTERHTQRETSPEKARSLQQQYLTSRLLQRTPSSGAPPQMTSDMAQVHPNKSGIDSSGQKTPLAGSSGKDGPLTSRFVDGTAGSGGASQGSTIHPSATINSRRSEEIPRRPKSMADLNRSDDTNANSSSSPEKPEKKDDSALVPRTKRRTGLPGDTSRIQQKLNLQRESSDVKTGPTVPVNGGMDAPLIGANGPGYDGANSRDPRVGKLVERADSEYLVVRRYQNPIARSINRLKLDPELGKALRIPKGGMTGSIASRRSLPQHVRNLSTPAVSRPVTPRTAPGSFTGEADDARLSGSSLVGDQEDDTVQALLRGMWEKPMDLSASAD